MWTVLRLYRWSLTRFGAWAVRHPWGGLIVGSFVTVIVHDSIAKTFSYLFPTLSIVIYDTLGHMLPILFFASGLFLLVVLGFLLAITFPGRAFGRRAQAPPSLTGHRLVVAVLVIGGSAGVAFIDSYISYNAGHRTERADRP